MACPSVQPTLGEISALGRSRPSVTASVTELADWYRRKAATLASLATDPDVVARHPDEVAEYTALAATAHQRAVSWGEVA